MRINTCKKTALFQEDNFVRNIRRLISQTLSERQKKWIKKVLSWTPGKSLRRAISYNRLPSASRGHYYLKKLSRHKVRREKRLTHTYNLSRISKLKDDFVIYRIIGNDLINRHKEGQSRVNLRFILENEPTLTGCEKRWIVNRIINPEIEQEILTILDRHDQQYTRIPFQENEYQQLGWDFAALPHISYLNSREFLNLDPDLQQRLLVALYRNKNNYVMNNNGARNLALEEGKSLAKWVLPWDGNCFLTAQAWDEISKSIADKSYLKYHIVPMQRITDNSILLSPDLKPTPLEEPQIIFRRDAEEHFKETFCHGRRPKVELLWRPGAPGIGRAYRDDKWDQPRRKISRT